MGAQIIISDTYKMSPRVSKMDKDMAKMIENIIEHPS